MTMPQGLSEEGAVEWRRQQVINVRLRLTTSAEARQKKSIREKRYAKTAPGKARIAKAKQRFYEARPERVAGYCQKWRVTNPEKKMLAAARHRAKARGIEFSLEASDIVIPLRCPILGLELKFGGARRGAIPENSPSIDRVDNKLGYIRGNVIVISWRANRLKGDASVAELQALAAFYSKASTKCA